MVNASKLSQENIISAMKSGQFYSSSGVKFSELELYKNWLHDTGSGTKLEKKKLAIFKQLFEEVKSNETN